MSLSEMASQAYKRFELHCVWFFLNKEKMKSSSVVTCGQDKVTVKGINYAEVRLHEGGFVEVDLPT